MRTTLLGFAIAIILALVTALVGPRFLDWERYRNELEATASRVIGLQVQVDGPIDVRILPTPTLTLQQIAFGRPGDPAKTRARVLRIEYALGALMRGELRAASLKLEGPQFVVASEESGWLGWPASSIGLDPYKVSVDRFEIEDARATFTSGTIAADFTFDNDSNGTAMQGDLFISNVEAAELLGWPSLSGRLTLDLHLGSSGRSLPSLMGALKGDGTFELRDGSIAQFDPAAFDAATRAVDQGLPLDATRIRQRMEDVLLKGSLQIPLAEGSIDITKGVLRLDDTVVHAKEELEVSAYFDLIQRKVDARLVLSDRQLDGVSIYVALQGPTSAPNRTLDVSGLTSYLALRAVDQQAYRLDRLERAAREQESILAAPPPISQKRR